MALIDPDKEESILNTVKEKYIKAFPALEEKYLGTVCASADGVDLSGGIRR